MERSPGEEDDERGSDPQRELEESALERVCVRGEPSPHAARDPAPGQRERVRDDRGQDGCAKSRQAGAREPGGASHEDPQDRGAPEREREPREVPPLQGTVSFTLSFFTRYRIDR